METWLLLTAYRKSPSPYLTVPSPTFYDLSFTHNTFRHGQMTNRQTDRTDHRCYKHLFANKKTF